MQIYEIPRFFKQPHVLIVNNEYSMRWNMLVYICTWNLTFISLQVESRRKLTLLFAMEAIVTRFLEHNTTQHKFGEQIPILLARVNTYANNFRRNGGEELSLENERGPLTSFERNRDIDQRFDVSILYCRRCWYVYGHNICFIITREYQDKRFEIQ